MSVYENSREEFDHLHRIAEDYLTIKSHESKAIYQFMGKYGIGKSEYGALMDAAAKGKHVMAHRLYGHHILYDFPKELDNVLPFLEHEFSDLFTQTGLPIIPGKVLEQAKVLKYFQKVNSPNWNFVNGFDILSATVAIYYGSISLRDAIKGDLYGEDLSTLAKTLGVGVIELAIACSTANPFLLIGAILQISSGLVSIKNDALKDIVVKFNEQYSMEFYILSCSMDEYIQNCEMHIPTMDDYISSLTFENTYYEPTKEISMKTKNSMRMALDSMSIFNETKGKLSYIAAYKMVIFCTFKSIMKPLLLRKGEYLIFIVNDISKQGFQTDEFYDIVDKSWDELVLKMNKEMRKLMIVTGPVNSYHATIIVEFWKNFQKEVYQISKELMEKQLLA